MTFSKNILQISIHKKTVGWPHMIGDWTVHLQITLKNGKIIGTSDFESQFAPRRATPRAAAVHSQHCPAHAHPAPGSHSNCPPSCPRTFPRGRQYEIIRRHAQFVAGNLQSARPHHIIATQTFVL